MKNAKLLDPFFWLNMRRVVDDVRVAYVIYCATPAERKAFAHAQLRVRRVIFGSGCAISFALAQHLSTSPPPTPPPPSVLLWRLYGRHYAVASGSQYRQPNDWLGGGASPK